MDDDDLVTITCNGLSNTYIDGEGKWELAGLVINKEQKNNKVEIRSTNFANALTTAANFLGSPSLSLLKGTFKQNNMGSIDCIIDPINGKIVDYTILSDICIEIEKGTLLFSTLANVILEGDLIIKGGEIKIAPYATYPNGNLLYSSSKKNTPNIELYKKGNLIIAGRLINKNISTLDKINIILDGGSIVLGNNYTLKLKNHFYLTPNSICKFIDGKIIIYHSFSNSAILNKINLIMNKNFIFYKNEILLTNFFT